MNELLPSAPQTDGATPVMAQYLDIKGAHPGYLLFYRMGDFYELFFEDAARAAEALDIALTKRGRHLGEDIPMCGVPVHAADAFGSPSANRWKTPRLPASAAPNPWSAARSSAW